MIYIINVKCSLLHWSQYKISFRSRYLKKTKTRAFPWTAHLFTIQLIAVYLCTSNIDSVSIYSFYSTIIIYTNIHNFKYKLVPKYNIYCFLFIHFFHDVAFYWGSPHNFFSMVDEEHRQQLSGLNQHKPKWRHGRGFLEDDLQYSWAG